MYLNSLSVPVSTIDYDNLFAIAVYMNLITYVYLQLIHFYIFLFILLQLYNKKIYIIYIKDLYSEARLQQA